MMSDCSAVLNHPTIDRNNPKATIEWLLRLCEVWQEDSEGVQLIAAGRLSVEFGYLPNPSQPKPPPTDDQLVWIEWLVVSAINMLLTEAGALRTHRIETFTQDATRWLASQEG